MFGKLDDGFLDAVATYHRSYYLKSSCLAASHTTLQVRGRPEAAVDGAEAG